MDLVFCIEIFRHSICKLFTQTQGHSSSLMRATSADLEEAILPPNAIISKIDRLRGPYNPNMPQYIEEGLSWDQFFNFLESRGL